MSHDDSIHMRRDGDRGAKMPDPEVALKPRRRQYSAEYKQRVLQEYEACAEPGGRGALLRREGLYSSHISTWRRQRSRGELAGLAGRKRGPKVDPQAAEIAQLLRDNERLRERLQRAELIIDVQKNVSQLLGLPLAESEQDSIP
jgi:transposase